MNLFWNFLIMSIGTGPSINVISKKRDYSGFSRRELFFRFFFFPILISITVMISYYFLVLTAEIVPSRGGFANELHINLGLLVATILCVMILGFLAGRFGFQDDRLVVFLINIGSFGIGLFHV